METARVFLLALVAALAPLLASQRVAGSVPAPASPRATDSALQAPSRAAVPAAAAGGIVAASGSFTAARYVPLAPIVPAALPRPAAPDAPRLLLAPADFAQLDALARSEPWAGEQRAALLRRAADWPASHNRHYGLERWAPPSEGGGWGGHYICPDDGAGLVFSPGHNRCPRCGRDYHGWPADYVVYTHRHSDNAQAVRDLGLAFRLSGDRAFAAKVREVLLAYAALYPTLPIRSHKGWPAEGHTSGGRVTSQTLNESDWVLWMAFGYDLVRETLPQAERARIERDLLRNASDVIARRPRSLGNWTARHNAAHLAVGLLLGDRTLVSLALDSEFGWRDQLARGIAAEGSWHERSWGYHFYAMEALLLVREMASRAGFAAPEEARLRLALDAPLACVLPNGRLPNFSDSHGPELGLYGWYYDIGYKLWGDPRHLDVARRGVRQLQSFLWGAGLRGAGASGAGAAQAPVSAVLPESGFATLRAAGSDHTVALKFGPHGGGHGHHDKLNFVSYAGGRMQAVDPGTQSYAYRTHATWDKVTLAHNTVVVDETTQGEAEGRLLEWHPGPVASAVRADAGPAYPQARLQRLLVHTAGYLLDVFTVESLDGAPHRIDWAYHNDGIEAATPLVLAPYAALPGRDGYQHLSGARATTTAAAWETTFVQRDGGGMRLRMLGAEGTTVVLAKGLGQDLTVSVPCVLARRTGRTACFITLLEPLAPARAPARAAAHELAPSTAPKSRATSVPAPGASSVFSIRLAAPDLVVVESAAGRDEIGIAPARYHFTRTHP